ncbi:MAG: tetratricopeptide repeat protein [Crocinitomicaceae bacterium]
MKSIIITILLLISGSITYPNEVLLKSADSAYQAHQYDESINLYTQILSEQKHSASLYFNLGNAYFKNNEIGKAIWAYHKAKKIDPKNDDINYNLKFASDLTKDKIEQSNTGISKWVAKVFFGQSINFWAIIALVILVFSSIGFYMYKITKQKNQRAIYLIIGIITATLFLITFSIAITHKNHVISLNHGIVIESVIKVRTAPTIEDATAFELHEGAKFKLIQNQGDWYRIKVGKNEGWILKQSALLY